MLPLAVALFSDATALAGSIGAVFAFTASTLCPLLLLGIWWRGLTDVGAIAGMIAGAVLCGGASLAAPWAAAAGIGPGLLTDLLNQPAIVTVPLAFAVMILGSLLSADRVPRATSSILARLHTPEDPARQGFGVR